MEESKYVCEPHYDENGNFDYWNPLFPYKHDTCVNLETDPHDSEKWFECSSCKATTFTLDDLGNSNIWDGDLNYCPNCGAKVVE